MRSGPGHRRSRANTGTWSRFRSRWNNPARLSKGSNALSKLREIQINPMVVGVVVLLIVAVSAYVFFIRPGQQENRIRAEWTSDEAVAARGPNAPKDPSYEAKVKELLAKEGIQRGNRQPGAGRTRE